MTTNTKKIVSFLVSVSRFTSSHMKGGRFSPGQAYVAFSRVKTLDGLHILNFNPKAIKASQDVKDEMARLNHNLLSPITSLSQPNNCIHIALLNIRSIIPKLPDIAQDSSLNLAQVLCFTETWLAQSQTSPHLADHQSVVRADRVSSNSQ